MSQPCCDITVELSPASTSVAATPEPIDVSVQSPDPVVVDVDTTDLHVNLIPEPINVEIGCVDCPPSTGGGGTFEQQFYFGGTEPAPETLPKLWLEEIGVDLYEMRVIEP